MLVMHFGHRDPEMHSHDATSYYAAIRPASAASHHYAVRHSSHNDFTPGCVACFARTTPGYRGLLDPAFGSPVSSNAEFTGIKFLADGKSFLIHLQYRTQEGSTVPNTTDELWVSGFHIDKAE
jgi:hypothetical protein